MSQEAAVEIFGPRLHSAEGRRALFNSGAPPERSTLRQMSDARRAVSVRATSTLRLPARDIPVPASLSPQAQAIIAMGPVGAPAYPKHDDAAWRTWIAERDAEFLSQFGDRASNIAADVDVLDVEGVRVYLVKPQGLPKDDRRAILEIHGGAFVMGGAERCRIAGLRAVGRSQVRTCAVDYRMPPDHPYPAPLDDCVTVYRALLEDHDANEIIVSGGSAGGNLAAALILRARDEGLPLPAAAVLMTPEVDLTESGDSFRTNLGLDNVLTESLMQPNLLYAGGYDLTHPYVSPLFADFRRGFPPTILTTGTRDLFLSNTIRMHRALRAAGVPADLHVVEAAGHGGFFGLAPEDADLEAEIRRFIDAHWLPPSVR
jgi:epsilon-lactone hydrolase